MGVTTIETDFAQTTKLAEEIVALCKGKPIARVATALGMATSDVLAELERDEPGVAERFIHNLRATISESLPETNS